jgi:hypothetical protein
MNKRSARYMIILAAILTGLLIYVPSAQNQSKKQLLRSNGAPKLWTAPNNISSRDLFLGPGGEAMKPDLRQVTYLGKHKGGTSTKYRVRDASGREWIAKLGEEAQAETAAVRLVWAAGYPTEINYLIPRLNIVGKGVFRNVRLEARPDTVKRLDEWSWTRNPFVGTREFQGLKVMMALINNWDLKDINNKIFAERNQRTDKENLNYAISDLGATFGKSGGFSPFWRFTRSRNKPNDFAKSKFIKEIKHNRVYFAFNKKNSRIFENVSVADARWVGDVMSGLSREQITDAFRAANYNEREIALLTDTVRRRIIELEHLPEEVSRLR